MSELALAYLWFTLFHRGIIVGVGAHVYALDHFPHCARFIVFLVYADCLFPSSTCGHCSMPSPVAEPLPCWTSKMLLDLALRHGPDPDIIRPLHDFGAYAVI